MFVRSRLSKDIVYRKRGKDWIIKSGTVTYVDENQVTAQELRKLYSTRIEIMTREHLETMEKEIPVIENKKDTILEKDINRKPLDNSVLDEILTEIKDEVFAKEDEKPEIKAEVIDPIKEAFVSNIDELDGIKETLAKKEESGEINKEIPTPKVKKEETEKPKKASRATKKPAGKRRGRAKKASVN